MIVQELIICCVLLAFLFISFILSAVSARIHATIAAVCVSQFVLILSVLSEEYITWKSRTLLYFLFILFINCLFSDIVRQPFTQVDWQRAVCLCACSVLLLHCDGRVWHWRSFPDCWHPTQIRWTSSAAWWPRPTCIWPTCISVAENTLIDWPWPVAETSNMCFYIQGGHSLGKLEKSGNESWQWSGKSQGN